MSRMRVFEILKFIEIKARGIQTLLAKAAQFKQSYTNFRV